MMRMIAISLFFLGGHAALAASSVIVDDKDVADAIARNVLVWDVRPADAYARGHIAGPITLATRPGFCETTIPKILSRLTVSRKLWARQDWTRAARPSFTAAGALGNQRHHGGEDAGRYVDALTIRRRHLAAVKSARVRRRRFPPRVQARVQGHRQQASGLALYLRAHPQLAQDEEPGGTTTRTGRAGAEQGTKTNWFASDEHHPVRGGGIPLGAHAAADHPDGRRSQHRRLLS
jgi:rhodanese-related sulfurtransferase